MKQLCSLLMVIAFFSFSSCDDDDNFFTFSNPEVNYQIYPGREDILRMVSRGENGADLLQLFDAQGKLQKNITMTSYPSFMTGFNKDSVFMSYIVGPSDLEFFLPWFKAYKFNPKQIGNYKLTYNYRTENGTYQESEKTVDSVFVRKSDKSANLFLNKDLVQNIPIRFLFVYEGEFRYFDEEHRMMTTYHLKNSHISTKFLKDIVAMYSEN